MVDRLLEIITERGSIKFCMTTQVDSVTNAIDEIEVSMIFLVVTLHLLCTYSPEKKIPTLRKVRLPSRHEMSVRDLNQISIDRGISETSQKHRKRDVFFVTSLRRLKNISKKMSFL